MADISKDLVGIAGVHYVVSKLSMRGIVALPTVRNTPGVDIIVPNKDGSQTALLQVKASGKNVKFWPTPNEEKILTGKSCYYIFLRYVKQEEDFEAFLVECRKVKEQVSKNMAYYRKKGRKEFPYFELYKEDEEIYRREWEKFKL